MAKITSTKEEKHEHNFGPATRRCPCGAEWITPDEYDSRVAQYNAYYSRVKQTESYRTYWESLKAFKAGDIAKVKELGLKARERLAQGNYLPKPAYVDPTIKHKEYEFDQDGTTVKKIIMYTGFKSI